MAQVEVLGFSAFYREGQRGAHGGAAQNDKVWGIAKVGTTLVTFWGRRNGVLKFKTQPNTPSNRSTLQDQYIDRLGYRRGRDQYTQVAVGSAMQTALCPNLEAQISRHYFSGMSRGTLNTMAKAS